MSSGAASSELILFLLGVIVNFVVWYCVISYVRGK